MNEKKVYTCSNCGATTTKMFGDKGDPIENDWRWEWNSEKQKHEYFCGSCFRSTGRQSEFESRTKCQRCGTLGASWRDFKREWYWGYYCDDCAPIEESIAYRSQFVYPLFIGSVILSFVASYIINIPLNLNDDWIIGLGIGIWIISLILSIKWSLRLGDKNEEE